MIIMIDDQPILGEYSAPKQSPPSLSWCACIILTITISKISDHNWQRWRSNHDNDLTLWRSSPTPPHKFHSSTDLCFWHSSIKNQLYIITRGTLWGFHQVFLPISKVPSWSWYIPPSSGVVIKSSLFLKSLFHSLTSWMWKWWFTQRFCERSNLIISLFSSWSTWSTTHIDGNS